MLNNKNALILGIQHIPRDNYLMYLSREITTEIQFHVHAGLLSTNMYFFINTLIFLIKHRFISN